MELQQLVLRTKISINLVKEKKGVVNHYRIEKITV